MNVISVSQIVTLEIKICRCLREQTEQSDEPWLLSRLAGSKPRERESETTEGFCQENHRQPY